MFETGFLTFILIGVGFTLIGAFAAIFYMRSHRRQTAANFEESNIDLMEKAMDLIPNLTLTTHIATLARVKGHYPFKTYEDFFPLTGGKRILSFKGRMITFEQGEKFFPKEFFPIENEEQLLCRLLIAFQRGDFFHAEEYRRNTDIDAFVNKRNVVKMPQPK